MNEHQPDNEPTEQFYAGPSGPPPSGGQPNPTAPLWFGEPAPAPAPAARKSRRGGRLGLAAGAVATALIVGGGAGYGGAALFNDTHDDSTGGLFSSTGTSTKGTTTAAPSGSIQAVATKVLPSVVKIEVAGSQESGSGSGIILTADGTILTNNHVVEIAGTSGKIRVDFNDGTSADAKVLGTDSLTDTAVIKVDKSGLTPATIGSSNELAVGQSVVAIGSPFGLDSTVTSGIVSALNRPVNVGSDSDNNATVYPAIQTDAAINPGNSGGPLVNMDGQVIGINASIRTASDSTSVSGEAGSIGLGFAIPLDEVKPIIEQMIKGETPTHARLGITVHDVGVTTSDDDGSGQGDGQSDGQGDGQSDGGGFDPFGGSEGTQPSQPSEPQQSTEAFSSPGAQIQAVTSGSTAAKSGLKAGDIIMKVDSTQIVGSDSLVATIRAYRPGDKVELTYTRDDKEHTVSLTLDSDGGGTSKN
ncbi:S1C family serine protease [Nocardioides sp. Kera G14]|uniref:S1C family serine protease n=1 Tax=Nocardioides sp. Kera G14 TaxID=2884264 RepID=UPI001D12F4A7|nr:trypsin-like peptidase domain-containing protein [Nocardioides sp. Kera G14]UDY24290.1 trypsin-like peptidase domain-containing protein [Nocardioides sp. Kera G14]